MSILSPFRARRARPGVQLRRAALLVLGLGLLSGAGAAESVDPWERARLFDHAAAAQELASRHAQAPDDARVAVAYASALLVRPPVTADNVERARALLAGVEARADVERDLGLMARYLMARIDHVHRDPHRLDEARARYVALLEAAPEHVLGGQAAAKLALMTAWQTPGQTPEATVAELRRWAAAVRDPAGRREVLRVLAEVLNGDDVGDRAGALEALVAAREIGYRRERMNEDLDLAIGSAARELGRPALAAKHFRAFLASARTDVRARTVRAWLDEIEATSAGAAGGEVRS